MLVRVADCKGVRDDDFVLWTFSLVFDALLVYVAGRPQLEVTGGHDDHSGAIGALAERVSGLQRVLNLCRERVTAYVG